MNTTFSYGNATLTIGNNGDSVAISVADGKNCCSVNVPKEHGAALLQHISTAAELPLTPEQEAAISERFGEPNHNGQPF